MLRPTQERVLVGSGNSLELLSLGVVAKPSPATALNTGGRGVKSLLEVLERAKVLLDLLAEGRRFVELCLGRARRRKVLPEEGVVAKMSVT